MLRLSVGVFADNEIVPSLAARLAMLSPRCTSIVPRLVTAALRIFAAADGPELLMVAPAALLSVPLLTFSVPGRELTLSFARLIVPLLVKPVPAVKVVNPELSARMPIVPLLVTTLVMSRVTAFVMFKVLPEDTVKDFAVSAELTVTVAPPGLITASALTVGTPRSQLAPWFQLLAPVWV